MSHLEGVSETNPTPPREKSEVDSKGGQRKREKTAEKMQVIEREL